MEYTFGSLPPDIVDSVAHHDMNVLRNKLINEYGHDRSINTVDEHSKGGVKASSEGISLTSDIKRETYLKIRPAAARIYVSC